MIGLAFALGSALLLGQAPSTAVPGGWAALSAGQRAVLLKAAEPGAPLDQRLLHVSERFLGTRYLASPLGEGSGVDPDPTFRTDAVDCLTFVEETLALSLARQDAEVPTLLEHIRYASTPVYEDRNHLMEAQWLPNNLRKGFLVDVTRRYGGQDTVQVQKVLTERTWTSRSSQELKLPKERQPVGTFKLDIIPLAQLLRHIHQVPSGTIMVIVRDDLPLKATRITHLGFVVQKGKRTWLRHAARNGYLRVVDEDLETFLARNARYTKWKVTGMGLFEAQRPAHEGERAVVRSP
jgi:hypothetical protein